MRSHLSLKFSRVTAINGISALEAHSCSENERVDSLALTAEMMT